MKPQPSALVSCVLLFGAGATGQAVTLPRVQQLGAMPDLPCVHVSAEGVRGVDALPAGQAGVVLSCSAATPCRAIATAIEQVAANGARVVFFAAAQPDGGQGAFGLALPGRGDVVTTLSLRAHRDRPGVPARSVVPLLTRLRTGWERDGSRAFALAIEVPTDATCQQLLSLLAAVAESGVQGAALRVRPADGQGRDGELAFDLDGAVVAQIVASDPLQEPVRAAVRGAHGARGLLRAPGLRPAAPEGERPIEAENYIGWLEDTQQPDGCAAEEGVAAFAATGLATLAYVGRGWTLDGGHGYVVVRRYAGWLLARQRGDGSFEAPNPGSLQRHAQITYALAEAAGMSSTSGDLLREAVGAAVRWLAGHRRKEGGWGASCGAPPDAIATAWSFLAITAASRHSLCEVANANDVVVWFDRFADDSPATAGAELLCRYLAGQEPETTPRLARLARLALDADANDPQATFWASYALYQHGGEAWSLWSNRLQKRVLATRVRDGKQQGSWHPTNDASRTITTALNLLSMEAYYRYGRLLIAR